MRKAQIPSLPDGNRAWMNHGTRNIKITYSWWPGDEVHTEIKALGIQETVQVITVKNRVLIKSQRLFLIATQNMHRKKGKLKAKNMYLKACMVL